MHSKRIPNISFTVNNQLCLGCGLCQDACPSDAVSIKMQKGTFLPIVNVNLCNNEKGCHRCFDTCPGHGIDLRNRTKDTFSYNCNNDKYVGRYLQCYTGYSNNNDIRWHSASGGMVTQFLIWLLERNYIDGAIVTKFDNTHPLMVKTFIATTREDILDARSSKYGPVTMAGMACAIKKCIGSRYVIVGLPCHIHGFRKMMMIDKKLKEKVIGSHRAGIRKIILPYDNKNDLDEIPDEVKSDIEFVFVNNYSDVFDNVFSKRECVYE